VLARAVRRDEHRVIEHASILYIVTIGPNSAYQVLVHERCQTEALVGIRAVGAVISLDASHLGSAGTRSILVGIVVNR